MSDDPPPAEAALRRRYLIYVMVRIAGIAIMIGGVWLGRAVGQVPGLAVVLLGGLAMFVRPRHLDFLNR